MHLVKRQRQVAPFIFKLYQLLENPDSLPYAFWQKQSSMFTISNVEQFCKILLPKYYKHRNFSSFVRQLNIYGFAKTKVDSTEHTYYHPNFNHDQYAQLKLIKRKTLFENKSEQNRRQSDDSVNSYKDKQIANNESHTNLSNQQQNTRIKYLLDKIQLLSAYNDRIINTSSKFITQILRKNNQYINISVDEQQDFVKNTLRSQDPYLQMSVKIKKYFNNKVDKDSVEFVQKQVDCQQSERQNIKSQQKKSLQSKQQLDSLQKYNKLAPQNKNPITSQYKNQKDEGHSSFNAFEQSVSQNQHYFSKFNNIDAHKYLSGYSSN